MKPNLLLTGTSGGLGAIFVEHLQDRFTVVGLVSSDNTKRRDLDFVCDLANLDTIAGAISAAEAEHGPISYLINNAAMLLSKPFTLLTTEQIQRLMSVNLLAPILIIRSLVPGMMRSGFGRIVNIGSMSPRLHVPGDSIYATSKDALASFAENLNGEVSRYGIRLNTVAVSAAETGMLRAALAGKDLSQITRRIPHARLAQIESLLAAVDLFLDPALEDLGGQTLYLGGVAPR